jgi:hypothetical protein
MSLDEDAAAQMRLTPVGGRSTTNRASYEKSESSRLMKTTGATEYRRSEREVAKLGSDLVSLVVSRHDGTASPTMLSSTEDKSNCR